MTLNLQQLPQKYRKVALLNAIQLVKLGNILMTISFNENKQGREFCQNIYKDSRKYQFNLDDIKNACEKPEECAKLIKLSSNTLNSMLVKYSGHEEINIDVDNWNLKKGERLDFWVVEIYLEIKKQYENITKKHQVV